jgi:hypothetical protein
MKPMAYLRPHGLARWTLGLLAVGTCAVGLSATGCLDRPVVPIKPGKGGIVTTKLRVSNLDKVDLLLMIDNSQSMGDKFTELGRRMPELIKALAAPDVDPVTMKPKTKPVADLHVGIITSSLGGHGTSVCKGGGQLNDNGHLLPRVGAKGTENGTAGYVVDSVGGAPQQTACPAPVAASALSWAFDASAGATNVGPGAVKAMETSVSCIVQSAGESGCGYEAQLEAIYHFLVDPAPYATADADCGAAGNACVKGTTITARGVDDALLKEREAFLRPDSILAVVMLTDENDGSIRVGDIGWVPLVAGRQSMSRGWPGCAAVPDDFEPQSNADYALLKSQWNCHTCLLEPGDPACSVPWSATALQPDVDGTNERMLEQTRRFGFNFLWNRQRYVDAFSPGLVRASDGTMKPNPIYAGGMRTKDQVVVAGILGVPKSLVTNVDGTPKVLGEPEWDKIVSPDHAKRDPHMIEQIGPRAGLAKFTTDRTVDPTHGGERVIADGNDLQFACIGPRNPSVANDPAAAAEECQPSGSASRSPLCGPDVGGKGTQPYFKAYPTLRELRVLHELQLAKVPAFVASLCDESYSPAIQGIIAKLQDALTAQCLKSVLDVDVVTGAVTCQVVEAFASDRPKGVKSCADLSDGKQGYCTPGAAPCRFEIDSNGVVSDYPPVGADVAAKQLELKISVVDPVTGATKNEPVTAIAEADGNVYVTGSDKKKHLVCEMMQLAGNPVVAAATQGACLTDPAFELTDGSGGWCYSVDETIVGSKCRAQGAVGSMRFFGTTKPLGGSEVFTLCVGR